MALSSKVRALLRPDGQKCRCAKTAIDKNGVLITCDGGIIDHPTRNSIQKNDHKHIEGAPESNAYLPQLCSQRIRRLEGFYLRALRGIAAGEEITCNYLTTDWELHERHVCHCGAPHCRGELKGLKYLEHDGQKKLLPFLPDFMKRKVFNV